MSQPEGRPEGRPEAARPLPFPDVIERYAATIDADVIDARERATAARRAADRGELRRESSPSAAASARWRMLRRSAMRRPLLAYAFLSGVGVGVVAAAQVSIAVLDRTRAGGATGSASFINATTYFAAIGVLIGAYQAWLNSMANQAKFVHDFFAKFFEKKEFYDAWYHLFYAFENDKFDEIDELVRSGRAGTMKDIAHFNTDREVGFRRWHPALLQQTPEEAKIDSVLGYLNLIGDFYERGGLSVTEIGDAADYYLTGVANSAAFRAYLAVILKAFVGDEASGAGPRAEVRLRYAYPPFRHLCVLLHQLDIRRESKTAEVDGRLRRIAGALAAETGTP